MSYPTTYQSDRVHAAVLHSLPPWESAIDNCVLNTILLNSRVDEINQCIVYADEKYLTYKKCTAILEDLNLMY